MLFGNVNTPGHPDPLNVRILDTLPVDQIRRMMRVGLAVDREWLADLSITLGHTKDELRKDVVSYIPADRLEQFVSESGDDPDGTNFNVDSPVQVAELLFSMLGVDGSRLKRTSTGKVSTGKKQLETIKTQHPAIAKILQYRETSKLIGSFCNKLPNLARFHNGGMCKACGLKHLGDHWRIHGQIMTTRTAPGRLAMKAPNLQQIPSRTKAGREVRKAFIPAPGCKLVSRDLAGSHLRILAHLAHEETMQRIFRDKGDIHSNTAKLVFGLGPDEKPDKLTQRDPSKTATFLIIYGGGGSTLYDTLVTNFALAGIAQPDWLTLAWCEAFIDKLLDSYPGMRAYFDLQDYRAQRYGFVWCPFGRVRIIPEVWSCHERIKQAGLRQAGNHPIIAMESGIYKVAQARVERRMIEFRSQGIHAEAVLPVHDELIAEVDEDWVEEVGDTMGFEMEESLRDVDTGEMMTTVPVVSDGCSFHRWSKG